MIDTTVGYDLICYSDCIEFHLEVCMIINESMLKKIKKIPNIHKKFKNDL